MAEPVGTGEKTQAFSDQFVDATDSLIIDVATRPGGDQWPSMISLDFYDYGGTILSTDARELAAMLVKAADSADALDAPRFTE